MNLKVVKIHKEPDNYIYLHETNPYKNSIIKINNLYYQTLTVLAIQKDEIALNSVQRQELKSDIGDMITIEKVSDDFNIEVKCLFVISLYELEKNTVIYENEFKQELLKSFNNLYIFPLRKYIYKYNNIYFIIMNFKKTTYIGPFTNIDITLTSTKNITIIKEDSTNLQNFSRKSMEELGIGGMQKEYEEILRRVFNSRLIDKRLIQQLNLKHVKGAILYGPPGTGKTLLSKQFSNLIGDISPIIVNGPEILNKYVGQSEENMRKLFEPARKNPNKISVIIFDEIDAICKERGKTQGSTNDGIVNQLLTLMDGINSLDNILIIGITNRLDMLDSALLRPGRFEVHLKINLPDIQGRYEIFNIYLKPYNEINCLKLNIEYNEFLKTLAKMTHNYSGAEINGVIRSATSYSLSREIDWDGEKNIVNKLILTENDIMLGLKEVRPKWSGMQGYIPSKWNEFKLDNKLLTSLYENLKLCKKIVLIGNHYSGKTQYIVNIAELLLDKYVLYINKNFESIFDTIDVVKPDYIFIDDLLDIIGYISLGCRYNTNIVLKLRELLKMNISIMCTCVNENVLSDINVLEIFDIVETI